MSPCTPCSLLPRAIEQAISRDWNSLISSNLTTAQSLLNSQPSIYILVPSKNLKWAPSTTQCSSKKKNLSHSCSSLAVSMSFLSPLRVVLIMDHQMRCWSISIWPCSISRPESRSAYCPWGSPHLRHANLCLWKPSSDLKVE